MSFKLAGKGQKGKKNGYADEVRSGICPYCGKKGFYNISHKYERCQCCGLHRVMKPWPDL